MLIVLNLISSLLQLPGLCLFSLFLVMYYYLRSREGVALVYFLITMLTCYALSIPIVSNNLMLRLESKYQAIDVEQVIADRKSQAIVALISNNNYDYQSHLVINRYVGKIYKNNVVPIIYSGYGLDSNDLAVIPDAARLKLLSNALISDFNINTVIMLSAEGKSYRQSINLVNDLLKKNTINEVFLVANAWHMQQAENYFNKLGINIVLVPIKTTMPTIPANENYKNFLPNMHSLQQSSMVLQEGIDFLVSQIIRIF